MIIVQLTKYTGLVSCIALMILSSNSMAAPLSIQQKTDVQKIIQLFKKNDISGISQHIQYPLNREQPLAAIHNANEMKRQYTQIFDEQLIKSIAQSSYDQWSDMGSRGIMFQNGTLWLNQNKISAINYQTKAEKDLKQKAISQQKTQLHSSLKQFKQPIFVFQTSQYLVRIDELANAKYRYASWKHGKAQSSQPDLVLNQGIIQMDGSGGNHRYIFKTGNYKYIVTRTILGDSSVADVSLTVLNGTRPILQQDGVLLTK